jgi:hypothetical protein
MSRPTFSIWLAACLVLAASVAFAQQPDPKPAVQPEAADDTVSSFAPRL